MKFPTGKEPYGVDFIEVEGSVGNLQIPESLATGDLSEGPLTTGSSTSLSAKIGFYPTAKLNFTYQIFGSLLQRDGNDAGVAAVAGGGSRRYAPASGGTSKSWSHSHFIALHHFPASKIGRASCRERV